MESYMIVDGRVCLCSYPFVNVMTSLNDSSTWLYCQISQREENQKSMPIIVQQAANNVTIFVSCYSHDPNTHSLCQFSQPFLEHSFSILFQSNY